MITQELSPPSYSNYLHVINHPLIAHKLTIIRDKKTSKVIFSNTLHEISQLMMFAITQNLPLQATSVETPMNITCLSEKLALPLSIVTILRAGIGMSQGMMKIMPEASEGYIGLYRDHETLEAVKYLMKIPQDHKGYFILVDPMLATGNSAVSAVRLMLESNIKIERIYFCCLIAAPEGIKKLSHHYPELNIFTASIDEKLDENAYIIPGLGDAGDRLFGTL